MRGVAAFSRLIAKALKQGYALVEDRLLEHPAVLDCLADGLDMAGLHVHAVLFAVPTEREDPRGMSLARLAGPQHNKHFLRYALGSLAECDTQLIIAESLGYGACTKQLKATIMSLTMGIRAYGKALTQP